MLQTAAVETAATNPAMQQLIADVHTVAPDTPIDQSVVAGYWSADMFIAAVKRAGKNLTVAGFLKQANKGFTYKVPNTVGPTKFPAAHNEPTPCGSLVRSDGSAYAVLVPYTCGKVVKVNKKGRRFGGGGRHSPRESSDVRERRMRWCRAGGGSEPWSWRRCRRRRPRPSSAA